VKFLIDKGLITRDEYMEKELRLATDDFTYAP
jgi:hypothetical protein